jgi:hypothetical protein
MGRNWHLDGKLPIYHFLTHRFEFAIETDEIVEFVKWSNVSGK